MKILIFAIFSLLVTGCSMLNPGFISSKPDTSNLVLYKSTQNDVKALLGEPAITQLAFNDKVVYKYFYETPEATVDQTAMIKGDYRFGCQNCGEIITTFSWEAGAPFENLKLRGISISDPQLKTQATKAYILIEQKQFKEAYPILFQAARGYFLPAQHTLGLMYINGDGVEKNFQQALFWLTKAAESDFPPALYDLGAMYRNGEGVERNTAIAKELYLKSANLNNSMAIQELIKIYKEENNEKQVSYWSKKYNQLVNNNSNKK